MEYGLYLAKVSQIALKDNRVRVRILPYMEDIPDGACPLWPFFFKDEYQIPNIGETVWVICDNEFSIGYVLGPANYSTYSDATYEKYSLNEDFRKDIDNVLVELKATKFNFSNLKVTFWNKTSIHFIERDTGGKVYAFSNGTLYLFRPDEFLVKIGDNVIRINSNDVSISSKSIQMQSDDVGLGKNPTRNVLTTFGPEGKNAEASPYVRA